jgi:iron complex transport system ATP-binding protein
MTLLSLTDFTVRRGECPVVDGVSLTVSAGECVGLLGPNGAGKTTLLRGALGLLPHEGGSNLTALAPAARARAAAFLPQGRQIAWPVSVLELVGLQAKPEAVEAALDRMGLQGFRGRIATELSGGEQARVLIARALAQDTALLLADEPVAGLDPEAQIRAMAVFRALADEGRGVVVSLHDLGLAARHCTRLVLMDRGCVVADGSPRDVLTDAILDRVFGVRGYHAETPDGVVFQATGVTR